MSKVPHRKHPFHRGKNQNNSQNKLVRGIVKRHPDGFGFLVPEDHEIPDVYIPREAMSTAMSGDRIVADIQRESGGPRWRGQIKEIVQRGFKQVSGRMQKTGTDRGVLKDESYAWGRDLVVTFNPTQSPKPNDWVVVRINNYPDSPFGFTGEVIKILGDPNLATNDNVRILSKFEIPFEFSPQAEKEARQLGHEVAANDKSGRRDLTKLPLVTIDGVTAKDFDDAVYVEADKGGYHLYVAIADVSHYVRGGSAIDTDAYIRGTSTYFPNFVAPMLPEALSNELCSLKPKVDRLALVADMHLDRSGALLNFEFYEAVIRSRARVTYGDAQQVLDGLRVEGLDHVKDAILTAGELAKVLMARRFDAGSLELEIPETQIEVDEAGQPVEIMRAPRLFAHRLIEELMLQANVAAALLIDRSHIPGIYRVHELPDAEKIMILDRFLGRFGYERSISGSTLQKNLTKALQNFSGKPEEIILNILALRSMSQAQYSSKNVGHFGLGFSHYTHFTSPIRRYPDLIVHRLIKSIVYKQRGESALDADYLATAGTMLSACEQRSVKAERQLKAIKKARFLQRFLGQEFTGTISSVAKFGIFVLLREYDIDGLVRVENLGRGDFEYDEENLQLVASRSGLAYTIGQEIKVRVSATSIDEGRIDFELLKGPNESAHTQKHKERPFKKRGKDKKDPRRSGKTRFSKSRRPRAHR